MKKLVFVAALLVGGTAMADVFVCQTLDGDLNFKIFNNTDPSVGTRNAAVMIISDPSVSYGNKTIATFSAEAATLSNEGTAYRGVVDLRRLSGGENIVGTKLSNLKYVDVHVYFSYDRPLAVNEMVSGQLVLHKRDGTSFRERLECKRYLKQR